MIAKMKFRWSKEHLRKKAVVGGGLDIEKPMKFNFVIEWD
jgi:hypothetical protein